MGADKLHQHALEPIGDVRDEPVFVANDIEDHPILGDEIHRAPGIRLNIGRPIPFGSTNVSEPSFKMTACLRIASPELVQAALATTFMKQTYDVPNMGTRAFGYASPNNQRRRNALTNLLD